MPTVAVAHWPSECLSRRRCPLGTFWRLARALLRGRSIPLPLRRPTSQRPHGTAPRGVAQRQVRSKQPRCETARTDAAEAGHARARRRTATKHTHPTFEPKLRLEPKWLEPKWLRMFLLFGMPIFRSIFGICFERFSHQERPRFGSPFKTNIVYFRSMFCNFCLISYIVLKPKKCIQFYL